MMCGQVPRSTVYDFGDARAKAVGCGNTSTTSGAWDWGAPQPPANSPNGQSPHDADLVAIHDILSGNTIGSSDSGVNLEEQAVVPVLSPTPVVALRDVTVRGIACGQDCFGAVTDGKDGRRLYTWGRLHARSAIVSQPTLVMLPSGESQPSSVGTPARPRMQRPLDGVLLVAMGMEHVAVLRKCASNNTGHWSSDRAQLWTWGSGTQGQLGHGDTISCSLPREVELCSLIEAHGQVASIAAGNEHTALMFDDGALCAFGCGYFGRLGLGTEDNWARPRLLEPLGVSL